MFTLYSMPSSGNSYKVRLLLAQLGIAYTHVATEWDEGRELTRQADFKKKNPLGKVPLVEFDDGRLLSESNAILLHFAEGTPYLPTDSYERALVYQWMFFEQYSHEPNIAVRTSITHTYPHKFHMATPEKLAATLEAGNLALDAMEERLAASPFLAGNAYSVADICLYAYTHSAEKGGFDFSNRPALRAWLERVAAQNGHVTLDWLPNQSA